MNWDEVNAPDILTLDELAEVVNRGWEVEAFIERGHPKHAMLVVGCSPPNRGFVTINLRARRYRLVIDHGFGFQAGPAYIQTFTRPGDGPAEPLMGRGWRPKLIRLACEELVKACA